MKDINKRWFPDLTTVLAKEMGRESTCHRKSTVSTQNNN
jgi:hypothetical protein